LASARESHPSSLLRGLTFASGRGDTSGVRWLLVSTLGVLSVVLALVLSWSLGAFNASAASCTKVGRSAVEFLDAEMARDVKLGAVYAVPWGKVGGGSLLAARIPGAGVGVWGGDLVSPGPNEDPVPIVEPENAVALENWRGASNLKAGSEFYGNSWERTMLRVMRQSEAYHHAVACVR
jgi:hypothetical protein